MDSPDRWLEKVHGIRIDGRLLVEAAKAALRTGNLARESALALPFDTDPTAFWRRFNVLIRGGQR